MIESAAKVGLAFTDEQEELRRTVRRFLEDSSPMGEVRQYNFVFRPRSKEQWLMMFGN